MTTYFSEWFKVEPADPAGYWLIPQKSSDPNEWALMELPNPVDEIARLAAENRALREWGVEVVGSGHILLQLTYHIPMVEKALTAHSVHRETIERYPAAPDEEE